MKNRFLIAFIIICALFLFLSYKNSSKGNNTMEQLFKEWNGKEIYFPTKCNFSIYGKNFVHDTIPMTPYKIVTYIDSLGCSSCKLRLPAWKEFINQLNSIGLNVPILFFIHPNDIRSMKATLRMEQFNYPVCMDIDDSMNKLNIFPSEFLFQTFLLDKNNRVIVIGNPVHNAKIKELYLSKLIPHKDYNINTHTCISVQSFTIDLGEFSENKRDTTVYIKNIGKKPLVILDVVSSCGCTVVNYEKK